MATVKMDRLLYMTHEKSLFSAFDKVLFYGKLLIQYEAMN